MFGFGIGDIVSIGFRIISHKDEIMKAWNEIAPLLKQATQTYGTVKDLVDKVAPGVIDQVQAQATADAPAAAPEQADPLASGDGGTFSAEWLQRSLNELVDTNLEVDGDIGEETRKAIRQFQAQEGLPMDGWAGAGTCARILQRLEEKKKAA